MFQYKVVLQLIESSGIGGAETVVLELCKRLDKKSFYPIVGLLNDGWLNQQLLKHGIETIIIKNKYPYDPFCLWQLIKIVKKRKVDIIHSHEFMMNVYGTIVGFITKIPVIATVHGKKYYWEKIRRRLAYRLLPYFGTKIVTVSANLRKFVNNKTGIPIHDILVINNGVDTENFNCNLSFQKKLLLKKELGVNEYFVIGTVGNPYPVKGHIYLIQSAHKIVRALPHVIFLIVGKTTHYLNELQKEVARLNLQRNIKFLGFREDVPHLLQIMDIFVLPSIEETFSLATIEAMASARPVVVTQCGGPEEIVVEGKTGFIVPAMNAEKLSEKILFLMGNRNIAKHIGQAAQKDVKQNYSLDAMINKYENLYSRIYTNTVKLDMSKK